MASIECNEGETGEKGEYIELQIEVFCLTQRNQRYDKEKF